MPKPKFILTGDLAQTSYAQAFHFQKKWREERIAQKNSDLFCFTSHPPVFTLGKRPCEEDFRSSISVIAAEGIEIVQSNRGGKITYHGPGQVVGYFIVDIRALKLSIPSFVNRIEEILIQSLAELGLRSERHPEYPGVWVKDKKIAALGLHFDRGVSMHGFSLNLAPNLDHYRHIVPCGIQNKTVTSLEAEGVKISTQDFKKILITQLGKIFNLETRPVDLLKSSDR